MPEELPEFDLQVSLPDGECFLALDRRLYFCPLRVRFEGCFFGSNEFFYQAKFGQQNTAIALV